ncbi:MAG: hypothetical protein WBM44_16435 [Waterburya sp.]
MTNKKNFQNQLEKIWKWCWDFLNRVGIIVTVAGTSGVLGLIKFLISDTRLITWIFYLFLLFLAGLLFYRFWNIVSKKSPRYSQKQIRFARISLFLIPCIIIFIP